MKNQETSLLDIKLIINLKKKYTNFNLFYHLISAATS